MAVGNIIHMTTVISSYFLFKFINEGAAAIKGKAAIPQGINHSPVAYYLIVHYYMYVEGTGSH